MGADPLALFDRLKRDVAANLETLDLDRWDCFSSPRDRWPGIKVNEVACLALLNSIFKKFEGGLTAEANARALSKFLDCNDNCLQSGTVDTSFMTELDAIIYGEMQNFLYAFFMDDAQVSPIFNFYDVEMGMGFGPGASVGAAGDSFYHKVALSPLTGTSRYLYSAYKRMTQRYDLWRRTEESRCKRIGGYVEVVGSKLTFAPKNREISRTIATEPLLNMFFQKGVSAVIKSRLREKVGIDLSTQPDKNAALACLGSRTGEFCTIDLSSASDTISREICRQLIPPAAFRWLDECRSPATILPDGRTVPLHMMASMGNDFCFPLQTVLFTSIVYGVYRARGIPVHCPRGNTLGNFGVFGDDIVVRREAYRDVLAWLRRCGFTVNEDKSYMEEQFRESCGSDFYNGVEVRGVYCRSLATKHDRYSLINRLMTWSCNHGIPLNRSIGYLLETVPIRYVPPWESADAGIWAPFEVAINHGDIRVKVTSGAAHLRRGREAITEFDLHPYPDTHTLVYRAEMPVPRRVKVCRRESAAGSGRNAARVFYDPDGVLLAAVGGYLRDGNKITIRNLDRPRYKTRWRIAPGWDYRPASTSAFTEVGWQRFLWPFAVYNLGRL